MTDQPLEKRDFFISYSGKDVAHAQWIANSLRRAGYSTYYQDGDFPPGGNFVYYMEHGIEICARTIAVLSENYLKSDYTMAEWRAAFAKDPSAKGGHLLPVRVSKCELPAMQQTIIYIDLHDKTDPDRERLLLDGVQKCGARPSGTITDVEPLSAGALSRVFHVPHLRNPDFTGRESYLTNLRTTLQSGEPAALTQAIAGLGGVGKTQLAIEYAYQHAADYDAVLWLRSEQPTELSSDYARIATALDLPEKNAQEQQVQIDAVRHWFDTHNDWLLIFDNATDPRAIHDYLPHAHTGHVLITSRKQDWTGTAQTAVVLEMEEDEAIDLLVNLSGCDDRDAAAKLALELGYLPLALAQAAAYIRQTKIDLAKYLDLFTERRAELWEHEKEPDNYRATVATTWSLAFEKLEQEEPHAITLLNCAAFLAPDNIPRFLFEQTDTDIEGPIAELVTNPLALNAAIAALGHYSFIEATIDAFSIHRLVQTVVRDRLDEASKSALAGLIPKVVEAAFPHPIQTNVDGWPRCEALIPHGLAAVGYVDTDGAQAELADAAEVLNSCGLYQQVRATFGEAKTSLEHAVRLLEVAFDAEHPYVATAVNNLGLVLEAEGDFSSAKSCYERALNVDKAYYGPDHPDVARDVNNLGGVLRAEGDLSGAKSCYERALRIGEATYGLDNSKVAIFANNLGEVLRAEGDLSGAKSCHERALKIDEATYGPDHFEVATDVNNLGLVLFADGDLSGAKSCCERALRIDQATLGPGHPNVARDLNNLGEVLRAEGDLSGAKACFERALSIVESAHGPDHPDVAIRVNNLGLVLRASGDLSGAKLCYERALTICTRFFGEDHPDTQIVRHNLESLGEK